ncbi:aminotransferase [Wenxinia marina]|uniref:Adenosylmethionine-8-amino-7-oxononanoate aminotransferase n=1 Tax=Wenxinia marina DSM 24838 TaxID=1123501 RepID=A0A0D0P8G9_9RHOB|nr:aminotransferase [Wenxinia marina]KIQ67876.1 Adenosylmethionine-8-amino-7-oxononanoate aminotransferase [Wenxinia marina DSM 24838]GGL74386.1 aspartate aminotransferase family protein [Wenxinia marina]
MSADGTPSDWALDRAHVLHPWTNFGPFEAEGSLVIERGEGCWLWDAEGRRYFDAVGGMWCTNLGLGRADLADAIADQVRTLAFSNSFVDMANPPSARLAAKLAALAPGDLNRVHFTTCGSTAVDTAWRMARYYHAARGEPGRTHVIARENSYHGSTYIGQSIGKRDGDRVPEFLYRTEGIHHVTCPHLRTAPDGMAEAAFTDWLVAEFEAKIEEVGAERIAAFFAEPIQASGGVIVPPKDYLRRMAEVCRRNGILFVADEVVTAFGRIGHWFASEAEFGVVPDIITCAKGLTSGYLPLGAVIFSDRIWQAMAEGGARWFTSGFTYSGHPVACRAALEVIGIMEREEILAHVEEVGAVFEEACFGLAEMPTVGEVRGRRLMICIDNVADKATGRTFPDEVNIGKRVSDACEADGLLVRPIGHMNVMSPPLVMTSDDALRVADTLGRALRRVADELVRDGVRVA